MENKEHIFFNELLSLIKRESPDIKVSQTKVAGWSFCNLVEDCNYNLISNDTYTGFSQNDFIAFKKATSEFFERKAFLKTKFSTSDGFAAYPNFPDPSFGKFKARENALYEATERYVWSIWWDRKTKAIIKNFDKNDFPLFKELVSLIDRYSPCKKIHLIEPLFHHKVKDFDAKTFIMFWGSKDGGFLCAGASGPSKDKKSVMERIFAELIRHAIAAYRARTQNLSPKSFYEERLCYFANGKGDELVHDRLLNLSNETIEISDLEIDTEINHKYSHVVSIHHCLIKNQPPFLEGILERFCI